MTIAEVSAKYGITADTLRYYERIGLLPPVPRSAGGIRNYGDKECEWVEFVKCMRDAGVAIEALTEYVRLVQQGGATARERLELLIKQRGIMRERAAEINECLKRLDDKINDYYSAILPSERKLGGAEAAEAK